jgi:hypothetical protein
LTVPLLPSGFDLGGGIIGERPQILIMTGTLLKNTPGSMKEVVYLEAEPI